MGMEERGQGFFVVKCGSCQLPSSHKQAAEQKVPSGDIAHSSVDGELRCNTRSPDSLCESLKRSAVLISQQYEYL
ncbi:hypothetical protein O3P69_007413 [Scylla paramamosain]|uniref:Uncharacterized protein n=1 Tax=Scylla paramamosain TaxID=85552 RepID=A0AAW0V486_SCYPA